MGRMQPDGIFPMNKEQRARLDSIRAAMHMNAGTQRWQTAAGDSTVTITGGIYIYHANASGLSHGTSLGNARAWVASKGTGEMESLYSVEIDREATGSMAINYYSSRHEYLYPEHENSPGDRGIDGVARTPLPPMRHGDFHFHPAYQQRSMTLVGSIEVVETLFVPRNAQFDDPAACYHVVRLRNSSIAPRSVTLLGVLHLPGTTPRDVAGRYDESAGALVACNKSNSDWVRVFGLSPTPDSYSITLDVEEAYYPSGPQDKRTQAVGETFGTLEKTVELAPGEEKVVSFLTVFSPHGEQDALASYSRYADFEQVFVETVDFFRERLMVSIAITPDLMLNQGAQWSKANMLRVLQRYKHPKDDLIAFTNDPGRGGNIVVRDAAWFTIGCDYLIPSISRQILQAIASMQEESGKIVEYWSGIDGHTEDYGLNINDNTPLFICAVAHHVLCTDNEEFAREIYPVLEKAARYILSQRDELGLVRCTATGNGVRGIAGWRNIIEDRTISGAVTEINSECFSALYSTGVVAHMAGKQGDADEFVDAANRLRDAINEHLKNPRNGLYYLTSNPQGQDESTVTADLVFPMIFKVADDETTALIMQRLLMPDFRTAAGLRTLSSKNPLYRPDSYVGLLGGVWPGVTWWFALACARYDSSLIVDTLVSSYQHYLRDPGTYNTVPGQFSEWFDGETLINRGMRLSPWEPPRYLWALLEGAMGLGMHVPAPGEDAGGKFPIIGNPSDAKAARLSQNRISPVVPHSWHWFALRNVPMDSRNLSYFAVRFAQGGESNARDLSLFGVGDFKSPYPVRYFREDVSQNVFSLAPDVAAVAFADEIDGRAAVVLLLGNMSKEGRVAPIEAGRLFDPDVSYAGQAYVVEQGGWTDLGTRKGKELAQFAFQIEAGDFRLCEFSKV